MKTLRDVPAKNLSTYGGHGVVKAMLVPETADEFVSVMTSESKRFILGGGSNTIIPDGEIAEKVISTKGLKSISFDGNEVTAECGVMMPHLLRACRLMGLSGLEFLATVPASVGGAVKMNAGAFGHEIGVYIVKMTVLSADCALKEVFPPYNFSYRRGADGTVVSVTFRLKGTSQTEINESVKGYTDKRRAGQPKGRSVGSTFLNVGLGAGYYIDKAGLKGKRIGGAEISTKHANFILNVEDGSAEDFLALVDLSRKAVLEQFGVTLRNEFKILGEQ